MTNKDQMQLVLLYSLMELDGGGPKRVVLQHIQDKAYWYKNDDNDEMLTSRPEMKWRNNFAYEREHLKDAGYLDGDSPGDWLITNKGKEFFYQALEDARKAPLSDLPCLMPAFIQKIYQMESDPEDTADQVLLGSVVRVCGVPSCGEIVLTAGPLPKGNAVRRFGGRNIYRRDPVIAARALARAEHRCEIDPAHPSFMKRDLSHAYTEPHHLIPLAKTDDFDVSLDREQNIFSLCSHCHNQIHYGTEEDVRRMITLLFERRAKEIFSMLGRRIGVEEIYAMYRVQ